MWLGLVHVSLLVVDLVNLCARSRTVGELQVLLQEDERHHFCFYSLMEDDNNNHIFQGGGLFWLLAAGVEYK